MRIIFFRHGHTDANQRGLLQGVSDFPLNAFGRKSVSEAMERIGSSSGYLRVYSSPLLRARQTAEMIGNYLDIPVFIDDLLLERNLGCYERMERSVLKRHTELEKADFLSLDFTPRGGESLLDVIPRACDFFLHLEQARVSSIVIVHGAWFKALASIRNFPKSELSNAEFIELKLDF